ncbi:hypothetical protein SAMN02746000_03859 [Paracoccus sp. J56]|nr:hypothetical protein SAMN02746000_03859 [Paracoccus sp. J56]
MIPMRKNRKVRTVVNMTIYTLRDENGGGKFVHGSGGLVLLRAA